MTWTQFWTSVFLLPIFQILCCFSLCPAATAVVIAAAFENNPPLSLSTRCFFLGWENRQAVVLRTGCFVRALRVWVRDTKNCMDLDQSLLMANSERCLGIFFSFCIVQAASQWERTSILMPEKYKGCSQNLILCLAANEAKLNLSLKICNLKFGGRMRILLLLYIRLLEFLISSSSRNDQNNLQFPKYIMPIHASY